VSIARRASPSTFPHDTTASGTWAISAPAGVTAGDLLVMKAGGIGTFTWTGPTGWTLIVDEASNSNVHVTMWAKIATGSDSYSITPSVGVKGGATVECYTGIDGAVLIEAAAHGVATAVASVVPSLVTTLDGQWLTYATISRHPTGAVRTLSTSDGSDTELYDHGTSSGPTNDSTFGSYDSNRALAHGTLSRTVTISTSTESQFAWVAASIRPAGSGLDAPESAPELLGGLSGFSLSGPAPSSGKAGGLSGFYAVASLPAGGAPDSGIYVFNGTTWQAATISVYDGESW
jgi:hypothetical protein